jgi:hypothetical protein
MTIFFSKIVPAALLCTLLAACGSGDMADLPVMAPVTLATLQGSSEADPAAVAAAALARPPVDGLAEAYRADVGSRPPVADAELPADAGAPTPSTQP